MKIRLAQALKEKNRLASEVERLWGLIIRENSKREDMTPAIDVAKTFELADQAGLYVVKNGQVLLSNVVLTFNANGFWQPDQSIEVTDELSGAQFYA